MEKFKRLTDMLEQELDRIESRGELTVSSLEQADTIAHTLKCLATYEAMESESKGGGYSEHYPMMYPYRGGSYDDGSSYARGRGRYARRDSMGRYSSDDGRSYDGEPAEGYSNRRY